MFRLLPDLPPNVVGIEAGGRIEAGDYRTVLEPAVAAALERSDKLRMVIVLGAEFEGYSAGAGWEDLKLGTEHWSAWERIAVVTDRDWIAHGVKALGWMVPGEVRVFATAERDAAVAWASV